jgi:hypothetical protein
MAIRYFTGASGSDWLTLSNWDNWQTSSYPTPADVVYTNNRNNILINSGITVSAITNAAVGTPAITGNGNFLIDYRSGNITIRCDIFYGAPSGAATITFLNLALVSGQTLTINGNITHNATAASTFTITNTGAGTINIFGNISGSTVAGSMYPLQIYGNNATINIVGNINARTSTAVWNRGKSTVNITGNTFMTTTSVAINNAANGIINFSGSALNNTGASTVTQNNIANVSDGVVNIYGTQILPSAVGSPIYENQANGTINVFADCYNSNSGAASAFGLVRNSSNGTVNIYGNIYGNGRAVSATVGVIHNFSTGVVNIYGNISGGSVLNSIAVSNNSTGIVNIYGNISGGTFTGNTPAIYSTTAGVINVYGNCVANAYPALVSTNILASNIVGGLVFNTASMPYYAYNLKITPTATTITQTDINNNIKILTTSGYTYGLPLTGDVRNGVVYGSANEYVGGMIVPSKSSVKLGTRFDTGTTYGEAITNVTDLNRIFSSLTLTYKGTT